MKLIKTNNKLFYKTFFSFLLFFLLFLFSFLLNYYIISPKHKILIFIILKTISLTLSVFAFISFSFYFSNIFKSKIVKNITVSVFSFILLFSILEIFYTYYTPSTNVFTDLSNKIWQKKYWNPINSLGYRDVEPVENGGKKNILITGDSFVAGHGVRYEDVFSSVLKKELSQEYNVFNLGVCGSHTEREYDSLLTYPIKPDIIILGYYHNDIESAMIKHNIQPKISNPKDKLSSFSKFLIDNSLFLNFIFSIKAKSQISAEFMESEQNDILLYLNEDIWNTQKQSLKKFKEYSNENNVRLIIVFIPGLGEGIAFTNVIAGKKIEDFCREENIEFINIYQHIKNLPASKRIANKFDQHPSPEVHKIIAKELLMQL